MEGPVLVTGATGFVGPHLLAELGAAAQPTDADVTEADETARAMRDAQPRAVVHLAARASVRDSWASGAGVWEVNAIGTVNVLEAVLAHAPSARVLVVSSGEVYGDKSDAPVREDQPLEPVSPYGASKAAAEIAAARAARADGLDVLVARPFPHVGPGQDDRFAVGSWTKQIAELEAAGGGTLRVGDLEVERDLTDVRDVCRAYRLLLEGAPANVYNVASGRTVRLRQVVEVLVGMARCAVSVKPDAGRFRRADIRSLAGDPSRLAEATGWKPEISLEQTLADALEAARRAVAGEKVAPV